MAHHLRRAAAMSMLLISMAAMPAHARYVGDFETAHQACAFELGDASVDLRAQNGVLEFSGRVVCNGATYVEILALTARGDALGGQADGPRASCGPCGPQEISSSRTMPDLPGVYTVTMTFRATGPGGIFGPLTRTARFVRAAGPTQPVRACESPQGETGTVTQRPPSC